MPVVADDNISCSAAPDNDEGYFTPCENALSISDMFAAQIAVEGCCHGSLDATYSTIASLEKRNGYTVDLLLIGGDFQAIRNHADLNCMAVPQKYRQLGEFYK